MKIGCNTLYPFGELQNSASFTVEALKAALDKLQRVGYEATEYSHACHLSLDEAYLVGEYARARGIESWSVHAEGPVDFRPGTGIEDSQASLRHCLDVCAALGGKVVVVHAPCRWGLLLPEDVSVEEEMARDLRILEPICERAQELGLELALENGHDLAHMEYVLQLVERLSSPHVGICVDTGHAHLGDLGAARAVRLAGSKLYTTHLQDNIGQVDDHMPPGQGTIDWPQVFAALREVGYHRPLILELTDRAKHRPYDQDLELRQGWENTRRFALAYLG